MFTAAITLGLILALPADTIGCGTYEVDYTLQNQVGAILTQGDGYQDIRSALGLAEQASDAPREVLTAASECDAIVQYFMENSGTLVDAAILNEFGWHHAVVRFGAYKIMIVDLRQPVDQIIPHGTYLLFFSQDDAFVTSTQI